ncbi:hypothetical protein ES703_16813 [subsurface metagenome]
MGTVVTAKVDGEVKGQITVTEAGMYGGEELDDLKLVVQDGICSGCIIEFYVNGELAEEVRVQYDYPGGPWQDVDSEWQVEFNSGTVWGLDLIAYGVCGDGDGGGGGGGGGAAPPPARELDVDMWGKVTSGAITEEGVLTEIIVATSADGAVTFRLAAGTEVLDCEGELVDVILVDPIEPPPPPLPDDASLIAAYEFLPCATFDPSVTLTILYDEEALPEGFVEANLAIGYYDEERGEWIVLPSVVDTFANTVTAEITHTTAFAALAPQAPAEFTFTPPLSISPGKVDTGDKVTITAEVSNTGGMTGASTVTLRIDGAVEDTQEVVLSPGESDTVTFTVSRDDAGTYSVEVQTPDDQETGSFTVTEAPFPWWAVGLGVGVLLLILLTYFFWWRRRVAYAI